MINRPNGSVQVSCAPRPEVHQPVGRPSIWNISPMPRPTNRPGMIRLAMAR